MNLTIFKDDQYSRNSTDNKNKYEHIIDDNSDYPTRIGITIKDDNDNKLGSGIILNEGFSSGQKWTWFLEKDVLFVLIGKSLFRIKLPEFKVLSKSDADYFTTFELFRIKNKLIVHGEQEISCFDLNGNKMWSFSGADIFATTSNNAPMEIYGEYIKLTDFNGQEYFLDFDGNKIKRPIN